MTLLLTREEIEAAKKGCHRALIMAECLRDQGPTLYRLRHESFPYAYRPGTKDQYLSVCIDRRGNFAIHDLGGFLTFVETEEELSEILHTEAEEPGALRGMITGRNNIKEMKALQEKARSYDLDSEPREIEVNLDDLELTI